MVTITIRLQKVSDAKRFYDILNNDNFVFFGVRPKTIEDEKEFLKQNTKKQKNNIEWNYTILYDGLVIGSIGLKIDQHRNYIGEIGYFIDESYWGKGIATKAVELIESVAFDKLKLKRLGILMLLDNIAAEKVAIKSGYKKEGILKKYVNHYGLFKDVYLYSKVV